MSTAAWELAGNVLFDYGKEGKNEEKYTFNQ